MHPRAIVGPPGTMPHMNPSSGMPRLRRSSPVANPPPMGGGGHGIGPRYYAATGELPPWCPARAANMVSRSGQTRVHIRRASNTGVSVGACFPKFDPIKQYGVGAPLPPAPNPHLAMSGRSPGIDPYTGMPRRRSRIWYR